MGQMTRVNFILFYSVFLFSIIQITAMMGQTLLVGTLNFTPPSAPTSILDVVGYIVANIGFFFQMMTVSTPFAIFGAFILTPFLITLLWVILELARGSS